MERVEYVKSEEMGECIGVVGPLLFRESLHLSLSLYLFRKSTSYQLIILRIIMCILPAGWWMIHRHLRWADEGGCKAPWIVSIVVSCSTMNYVNRWTGDINYPPRQIFRVLVMGWINVLEINLLGELLSRINNWISRIFRAQNPSGDAILRGRRRTNESFWKREMFVQELFAYCIRIFDYAE